MGKRGPQPRGEFAGKSNVLSTRIQEGTRSALIAAAKKSGRSLSQEIEHRLHQSFVDDEKIEAAFGDRRNYAIMKIIANTITSIQNLGSTAAKASWLDDPYSFDQAVRGVNAVLEAMRPKGKVVTDPRHPEDEGGLRQGELQAIHLLTEIQTAEPGLPLGKGTRHQHLLKRLRADLGPAYADRPQILGRTAEQTRELQKLGREFGSLKRKSERRPTEMTEADRARLHDLLQQINSIRGDKL
jgi:hypothetical protein